MRRARSGGIARSLGSAALVFFAAAGARAQADPCASEASVSPCFDADPHWLPTRPSAFLGVRSARAVSKGDLALVLGGGVSHRPVVLVTPSPHPEGQEIDAVRTTSTLLFGARLGLGHGIDAGLALPFVPYQSGAGTESITHQQSDGLATLALRDPRLELGATLYGRDRAAPLALGTYLELALPFGSSSALAGAAGPTVAPGFNAELRLSRVLVDADVGLRLVRATNLGTVRPGSSLALALGLAVELFAEPVLALGVEASLRPSLTSRSPSPPPGALDLPAEWLASVRFEPRPGWSFVLGGGSGLPWSHARELDGSESSTLGVTSPEFRAVALGRYTLPSAF